MIACLAAALLGGGTASSASCGGEPQTSGGVTTGTPCADVIIAGPGVDVVNGGGGDDRIYAASGGVTVVGGAGDDVLVGHVPEALTADCTGGCQLGLGSQTFDGGPGDDVVYGERGNDVLNGNEGDDSLYGGIGDDTENGGPGADLLSGGWGVDTLDGQGDGDLIRGDGSADRLRDTGSSGTDTLSYATALAPGFPQRQGYPTPPANFPAEGGERGVYVNLSGSGVGDNGEVRFGGGNDFQVVATAFENVIGSPFSDYIVGSSSDNAIYGGGGADFISGGGGTDIADGGANGDSCSAETTTSCGSSIGPRNTTQISVGSMRPGSPDRADLYLVGSTASDDVTATYTEDAPGTVTFTSAGSAGFDAAGGGCTASGPTATCTVSGPPDALVMFGSSSADDLEAASLPSQTGVVLAGGAEADTLTGGEASEDVLVDDPRTPGFDDVLSGLGRDDALLNNDGADQVDGGGGNDLFLSTTICDGDQLDGGAQRDNAAWPRFTEGIEARLGDGVAGRPGPGSGPVCNGGEQLDTLTGFEDLEGTDFADALYGGAGPNNLLGWGGADVYSGGDGDDRIFANAGDNDPEIACGEGFDRALIDKPPSTDSAGEDCEVVEEGDPGTFAFTPPAPTFTRTEPASPANDNDPEIIGVAGDETMVALYTSSDCGAGSSPVASGSGEEFGAAGITVHVPNNSTTTFYATASSGAKTSPCSSESISYTEATPDLPPTAVDDTARIDENSGPTAIDVLANDVDPDGGQIAVVAVTQPTFGAVEVVFGGTRVTYEPPPDRCGATSFTYTLNGGSTGTVAVTVTCPPEPGRTPPVRRCDGIATTRVGTNRRDVIVGTNRRDVIAAFGGNDVVRGLGGNDLVCGGDGRDTLAGGPGRDRLLGGAGADVLRGGRGRDALLGGPGQDRLFK